MQLFYEGDFEAATLNGNEILQLRQLTQLRDGRLFSIQLPGGSQVMPSDDIPPSVFTSPRFFTGHNLLQKLEISAVHFGSTNIFPC